jgi:hypothetical protein
MRDSVVFIGSHATTLILLPPRRNEVRLQNAHCLLRINITGAIFHNYSYKSEGNNTATNPQ